MEQISVILIENDEQNNPKNQESVEIPYAPGLTLYDVYSEALNQAAWSSANIATCSIKSQNLLNQRDVDTLNFHVEDKQIVKANHQYSFIIQRSQEAGGLQDHEQDFVPNREHQRVETNQPKITNNQMKCFVHLIEQDENWKLVKETKFSIEVSDNNTVYDLYVASLNKARWNHIIVNYVKFNHTASIFENTFNQYSDIHEEMYTVKVEPNSLLRFVIQAIAQESHFTPIHTPVRPMPVRPSPIPNSLPKPPLTPKPNFLSSGSFTATSYASSTSTTTPLDPDMMETFPENQQEKSFDDSDDDEVAEKNKAAHILPPLDRQTIGRLAKIGDLYDAYLDQPLKVNIFSMVPEWAISLERLNEKEIRISEDNTHEEKFEYMDVELELEASIIGGLVTPVSYGNFLTHNNETSNEISSSLIYKVKTQRTELTKEIVKLSNRLKIDFVENAGHATHFVAGIEWGIVIPITLTVINHNNGKEERIRNILGRHLKKIKDCLNKNETPSEEDEKFYVRLFTTDQTEAVQKSIKEIVEDIRAYYDKIMNNSKHPFRGIKIGYILRPLSELLEPFPFLKSKLTIKPLNFLSEQDIKTLRAQYIKTEALMRELKGLNEDINTYKDFLSTDYIFKARTKIKLLEDEQSTIKSTIGSYLTSVRKGEKIEITIENLVKKQETYQKSIETFIKGFNWDDLNAKMQYISHLQQQNVIYVGKNFPNSGLFIKSLPEYYVFYCYWREADKSENGDMQYFEHLIAEQKLCIFVDQDVVEPTFPDQCRICEFKLGSIVNEDLLNRYIQKIDVCYAKSDHEKFPAQKPEKAVQLEIRCPKSYEPNGCKGINRFWYCEVCCQCYWYYENYFYCRCGGASAFKFSYRCDDLAHGVNYIKYQQNNLTKIIDQIQPMKDIYILVLGLTGVGKSTWLNGFANYLTFSTLHEAANSEIVSLIPTEFSIQSKSMRTQQKIRVGDSNNERLGETGRSVTKSPKAYVFTARNLKIHLIDTPGIGDTEGTVKDKENFDSIIRHLQIYEELHGICILMKPNEARLTTMFKYCINELLAHLHMDAAKNIIFCMTNARQTFYSPGETLPLLVQHLEETLSGDLRMSGVEIEVNEDTVYCLDNEAIRYIYAHHDGIKFTSEEIVEYEKSWNTSQQITARMLEHVRSLRSHKMRDMITLNEARRITSLLSKPLADISRTIETNINALKEKQEELKNLDLNQANARSQIFLPQFHIELEPLDYPQTVCTARKCIVTQTIGNDNALEDIYASKCHEKCLLKGITPEILPNDELKKCMAFCETNDELKKCDGSGETCLMCGCSYKYHMHMSYNQKVVHSYVAAIQDIVDNAKNAQEAIEQVTQKCKETIEQYKDEQKAILEIKTIEQYKDEQKAILEISCKFGSYLKSNAIVAFNESIEEYIKLDIDEEKRQPENKINQARLQALERILSEYLQQKVILEQASYDPNAILEKDELEKELNHLFNLPITGKNIKEMYKAVNEAQIKHKSFLEDTFEIPPVESKNLEEVIQDKALENTVFAQYRPAPAQIDEAVITKKQEKKVNKPSGWMNWFRNFIRFNKSTESEREEQAPEYRPPHTQQGPTFNQYQQIPPQAQHIPTVNQYQQIPPQAQHIPTVNQYQQIPPQAQHIPIFNQQQINPLQNFPQQGFNQAQAYQATLPIITTDWKQMQQIESEYENRHMQTTTNMPINMNFNTPPRTTSIGAFPHPNFGGNLYPQIPSNFQNMQQFQQMPQQFQQMPQQPVNPSTSVQQFQNQSPSPNDRPTPAPRRKM
uniref:G domain-containing protein n=1 Tax=Acrobeloides nanus TaxID=290746 RepID=A0A914CD34_9BILA